MKKIAIYCVATIALSGCTINSTFQKAGRPIHVTNQYSDIKACYSLGNVGNVSWSLTPEETAAEKTAAVGADTAFMGAGNVVVAYVCDPDKVRAHNEFEAKVAGVRITNRQDVVSQCKFLTNLTAESESDAQHRAYAAGANVFYVISDTSRTAMDTQPGGPTYNYEVRRLTGEAYRCEQLTP